MRDRFGFRSSALLLAALALTTGAACASGLVLRYKFQAGAGFGYAMKTWANVPFQKDGKLERGEVTALSRVDYRVAQAGAHQANLTAVFAWDATPNAPAGGTSATFQVDDLGQVTNVQSPDMADPKKALIIRNLPFYFPRVPTEPVNIGSTWGWPVTVHMKAMDKLDEELRLSELKLDVTFKVVGLASEGGHRIAKLQATAREKSGAKYEVQLAGPMAFDLDAGRFQKSYLEGEVRKKVALITITVPVKVWIDPR